MHIPQSSTELRCSLRHAVECAERALASEHQDSLAGIRSAFAALQEAVEAVDAAQLEWLVLASGDEGELRALVQRVQALVEELLLKVESWPRPCQAPRGSAPRGSAPRIRGARGGVAGDRWLN